MYILCQGTSTKTLETQLYLQKQILFPNNGHIGLIQNLLFIYTFSHLSIPHINSICQNLNSHKGKPYLNLTRFRNLTRLLRFNTTAVAVSSEVGVYNNLNLHTTSV
jgi:hypothetical protein